MDKMRWVGGQKMHIQGKNKIEGTPILKLAVVKR